MDAAASSLVLVAHRRAPVQRLIRTNLDAEGFDVAVVATAASALALLRGGTGSVVVLDADLIRGDTPDQALLRSWLLSNRLPLLLVSSDPADRLLARALGDAPFLSRPDDVEKVCAIVHRLAENGVPA